MPWVEALIRTRSALATKRVGAALATMVKSPAIIALRGPLGSGKTTFTQGFVLPLPGGLDQIVRSPTFALAHTYPCQPPIHHLDLYRLDDEESAHALGLLEQLDDPHAISLVEWPERLSAHTLRQAIEIVFPDNPSSSRRLLIRMPSGLLERFPANWAQRLQNAASPPTNLGD